MNTSLFLRDWRTITPFPSDWPVRGCYFAALPPYFHVWWTPTLAFETLLFALNTVKCLSYAPFSNTPTVFRIFRDGGVYYICLIAYFVLYIVAGYVPNPYFISGLDVFMPALFSFCGSRLLLSIRAHVNEQARRESIDTLHLTGVPTFVEGGLNDSMQQHSGSIQVDPQVPLPSIASEVAPPHSLDNPLSMKDNSPMEDSIRIGQALD